MKKITLFITLIAFTFGFSQTFPIDFSTAEDTFVEDGGCAFALVANPDDAADQVGQITATGGQYENVQLDLDTYLDLTTANTTITFDFYSTTTVPGLVKLESTLNGNDPVEMSFSPSGLGWETITLDFSTATHSWPNQADPLVLDQYAKFVIFPDFGVTSTGTYYVDDIAGAANGAATTPPLPVDLPFDFETSPVTSDFTGFNGGTATVEAVAAPQSTGNTSTNLLKIVRDGGETWAGVFTVVETPLDFSTNSTITARIWTDAPIGTTILFKTEQDTNDGNNSGDKTVVTTVTGGWEDLVFDFSGVTNANQNKLVIIPAIGILGDGTATSTFYIDDIAQAEPETTPQTITVSVDVSANPGGVNIFTPTVTGEWAEYAATVDPNNPNIYKYTFAEGVTSAEYLWKVYTGGEASIQESLVGLVGGGAIENNLAATLPTGSGINTDYSGFCNRTVASTTGEFVEPTYIFNSFKRVGVTYTELVLNADAGTSYAIDYSVNEYSEFHGPGAVDNGDGTYTVIVDPTSAFTYLWYNITTSTQEDLSACDSPNRNHVAGENESDTFGACPIVGPTTSAQTPPARDATDVVSLYSDAYTNSTNWGAIEVFGDGTLTNVDIAGNNTYKMTSGFQYNYYSPPGTFEDLSSMTHMHVDFYVDGDFVAGSVLGVQLLGLDANQGGSGENTFHQTAFQANTWVSVDVPLANFNNAAPLITPLYEDIKLIQVNLQGPAGATFPTVYLDNLYFYREATQGLDDNVFNTVKMFPNPAKDTVQFSVNSNENLDIEIFDMLGKSVLRVNDVQNEVNISDLNSGLYFVQMTLGTQQATKKLIVN